MQARGGGDDRLALPGFAHPCMGLRTCVSKKKKKRAMAVHAADYKLNLQKTKCSAKYIEKCIALDATDTVAQPGQAVGRLRLVVPEGGP
jgi:hypothetical protein